MKPSIVAKLEALHERHEEVQALLGDAQTIADQERFRALSREYAQLSDVSRCFTDWQQVQEDIETAQMMLDDPEMREMAQDELREAKEKSEQLEQQLQVLLLPKDPDDERNAFLEVRAGTGGDEAALFAIRGRRVYAPPGEASIGRSLAVRSIRAAGLELAEAPVGRDDLPRMDELFFIDHRGVTALSRCDGQPYMAIFAERIAGALRGLFPNM